jgi:hypothetical protein
MISTKGHAIGGGYPMLPLPDAIILVLAPFAPLFSDWVWLHAQVLLLGAMLASGARTVTTTLQVMGLAAERSFTNDHPSSVSGQSLVFIHLFYSINAD